MNNNNKTFRYTLKIFLSMVFLATTPPAMAAPGGSGLPKKSKNKNEKSFVDPLFKNIEGQLSFDDLTKAALERGKVPGVLIAAQQESGKIFRIEIKGAKKIEPDAVALRLISRIGQDYNPTLISEDVLEIYKLGFFSDVSVYYEKLPSEAVTLRYDLVEIPTIFQIKITGNDYLSKDEIKESIADLQNYQGAKESRLKECAEKIREFYVSKGYYLAVVNYELKDTSIDDVKKRESEGLNEGSRYSNALDIDTTKVLAPDFVDVNFKITENRKVKINRVAIMGNKYLDEDLFKENIRTRENHLLSVLSDWGTFRKDYIEVDALILEKMLHDNGLLKAKILLPEVELSADKSFVNVLFRMIEGDQYSMGNVSITGDKIENSEVIYNLHKKNKPEEPLFLSSKLLAKIEQKHGEVFNKSIMAMNVLAIAEVYKDSGYAYVNVSPIPTFDDDNLSIDIQISIESGPQVYIERIDIEGNEKTKDEVIRRELTITEGDLYSSTKLRISEQNLLRLGYFETVEFTNMPGVEDNKMILKIKVKEQSTDSIQLSAGYGTGGEGIVLRTQLTTRNLFGRGQALMFSVNYSSLRRMFDLSFIEPYMTYVFDSPVTFAFTAYNRKIFLGEFNKDSSGGDFTFGYPFGRPFSDLSLKWKQNASPGMMDYVFDFDALWFYLTYTAERSEINDINAKVLNWDMHEGVPHYTTSIKPTIKLDQRDNRVYPTRGIYFEAHTEFASEYFGAAGLNRFENYLHKNKLKKSSGLNRDFLKPDAQTNKFIRTGTNFRFYHNLDSWFFINGFVFKTNIELGILNTLGQPLLSEHYALGGVNSVRGYTDRSISPIERASALFPFDAKRDVRIGGNKQFYGSMELEFPLLKMLKISGVLFFDYGNVYSHEDNFFYLGGKSANASRISPADPLGIYKVFGLYTSAGFGVRWDSPLGLLRFEFGFPLNPRGAGTPGLLEKDSPVVFGFNIGPSF